MIDKTLLRLIVLSLAALNLCLVHGQFGPAENREFPWTSSSPLWGDRKSDRESGKSPDYWNRFVEGKADFVGDKQNDKEVKWEAIRQFFNKRKESASSVASQSFFSPGGSSGGFSQAFAGTFGSAASQPSQPVAYAPPQTAPNKKPGSSFWDQMTAWIRDRNSVSPTSTSAFSGHVPESNASYWRRRNAIAEREIEKQLGHRIVLTQLEAMANEYFMQAKLKEFDAGFTNPRTFAPALDFIQAKSLIDDSNLFSLIKRLPKGALLGGHIPALVTPDFLYRLTKVAQLYFCTQDRELMFRFAKDEPDTRCQWKLLSEFRASLPDFESESFEQLVRDELSMTEQNITSGSDDVGSRWSKLRRVTKTAAPLINYRPNFIDHFNEVLDELYRDNIRYAELTTDFPEVYELDGTTYDKATVAAMYRDAIEKFKQTHRDFVGIKLIYSPDRSATTYDIREYKKTIVALKEYFPDLILGIQLTGQEDHGTYLYELADEFLQFPPNIKFYFNAGDTKFWGTPSDYDLIDALALKSVRISNAFAITKHPEVVRVARDKGIAVETSPISNQVMGLVGDLRNHPHSDFIATEFPLVVSSDRAGVWGASGVSYDWYATFMGLSPRNADLKMLKQLALNSYIYSSLPDEEKKLAVIQWSSSWQKFIEDFVKYVADS